MCRPGSPSRADVETLLAFHAVKRSLPLFNRFVSAAFAASLAVMGAANSASAQTEIQFALDWKFEGPAAPYFLAIDSGLFSEAGLDVTISEGVALTIVPLVGVVGQYDVGSADVPESPSFRTSRSRQTSRRDCRPLCRCCRYSAQRRLERTHDRRLRAGACRCCWRSNRS